MVETHNKPTSHDFTCGNKLPQNILHPLISDLTLEHGAVFPPARYSIQARVMC